MTVVCSNGESMPGGFGLMAGPGWPIDSAGRFDNREGIQHIMRGRFEGNRVVGVLRERSRRQYRGEELEPN